MKKLNYILYLTILGTAISVSAHASEVANKKGIRSTEISNLTEKELVKEKSRLIATKADLLRKRKGLVKDRIEVARKVVEIEKALAKISSSNSPKLKRSISNKLVKDEVRLKIQLVDIDNLVAEIDSNRLRIDKDLHEIQARDFKNRYGQFSPIAKSSLSDWTKNQSKSSKAEIKERAVLKQLEPHVVKYWGNRKLSLNKQVLAARKNRLNVWKKELVAHKSFLEMKQEDFSSKRKRLKERKQLLKTYFSLKSSRQQMNYELIKIESQAWQANRRMKYELSSLYRRLAYLKRHQKSKTQFTLLEPSYRLETNPSSKLRVDEYTLGVKYDDLYNWATRIVHIIDQTSAKEAGLKIGDEIVYVNDVPVIGSERGFKSLLKGSKDKKLNLTILREGNLYEVSCKLDYRPEEVSHPSIIKRIEEAKGKKNTIKLVQALIDEVNYVNRYSRNKKVADTTADELIDALSKGSSVPSNLKLKAYSACSSHYLTRMGDCLANVKKSKMSTDDISESAEFLNKADKAAEQVLAISKDSKSVKIEDCWEIMRLTRKFRKHYDFKQIGTPDTLKKLSDALTLVVQENAKNSPYQAAVILNKLSQVYELSLKDHKKAAQVLSFSQDHYLHEVPEEAKELTELRLVLARNWSKSGNRKAALKALDDRLDTLTSINSYSKKSQETGMYDYVHTLRELGKLYKAEGDYQSAYIAASTILDTYRDLDGIEDDTYNEALYLAGKSLLETGKPKKALPLLTDAYDRAGSAEKYDCLIDMASAYNDIGKSKEARIICLIAKDSLSKQLSQSVQNADSKAIGDRAVRVAQILDDIGDSKNAISLFDTAIIAYTREIERVNMANEDGVLNSKLIEIVSHLSAQMKKFNSVLEKAGRYSRAKSVQDFASQLETKVAAKNKFETDWLVRLP